MTNGIDMLFTPRHPLYSKQRRRQSLCPPLWHASQWLCSHCVCAHVPNCQIFAPAVPWVSAVYWRVEGEGRGGGREEDGQTVEMALHPINVITALIGQPFNQKGARTESARERETGRGKERETSRQEGNKGKESFACIQMYIPPQPPTHLLSSPPPSFHWLWWALRLLCFQDRLKSNTPRGNSWGSQGPLLSHTAKAAPPEPRGPNTLMDRLVLHSRPAFPFPVQHEQKLWQGFIILG